MNLFYLGSSCFTNDSRRQLKKRKLIVNNATQKREKYLFLLLLKIKSIKNFNFVSFGLGESNGVHKKKIFKSNNYTDIYLGYFGFGKLKYLSGILSAIIFLSTKVKSGDVLISYNTHIGYVAAVGILKIFKKITYIIEFEDFYHKSDYRYYFTKPFEKIGIILSDKFIVSSVGIKKFLEEDLKGRKFIVHSGYRNNTKTNKNSFGINKIFSSKLKLKTIKIIYTGTLDEYRGILDLIKIFSKNNSNSFELFISGDGPLKDFIIDKEKENSKITYLGNLNEEEYHNLLLRADICVNSQIPSIDINFPSKITQYLSLGKFVISTKCISLEQSEFSQLINFYDYSDSSSFWEIIESRFSKENHQSDTIIRSFNRIFDKMDKNLITGLMD